jgi:hypothetical protein
MKNNERKQRRASRTAHWIAGLSVAGMAGLVGGCVQDTDCGICDPDNLVLESITGVNYQNQKVHVLSPECEGDSCPSTFDKGTYFIEEIGPCEETEEAMESTRPDDYCLISPMITFGGVEFVFNNLLDPTSIELVRKRPDNPQLFEVYNWKSQIAQIQGPITRFNGDYVFGSGENPDMMARSLNLTCIENLGQDFGADDVFSDVCENTHTVDGSVLPLKMQVDGVMKSYRGETDWRGGACDTPDEGADTCCTPCDYELSVNVWKYGQTSSGEKASPQGGTAMECNFENDGDVFLPHADDGSGGCQGFTTFVDRSAEERRYFYDFGGDGEHSIPRYDKIRETHPGERPEEHSRANCQTSQDCTDQGLPGAACVGELEDSGDSCSKHGTDENCINRHCVAEWFVECRKDENTTGPDVGYCMDKRFKDRGAGACYIADAKFEVFDPITGTSEDVSRGARLAHCDGNENNFLDSEECCQESLGGGEFCDPIMQPNIKPVDRFDRNSNLPDETRDCFCGPKGDQREECHDLIDRMCTPPHGDLKRAEDSPIQSNEGQYLTRFVTKNGGVVYDPALKGVDWRAGDLGAEPRALAETCAEQQSEIGKRNVMDGWRAGDNKGFETVENFDRALCSGSEYEIVFNTGEDDDGNPNEFVIDKVGNKLDGKETYKFRTPEFHIVPGSGFPTDNLRIGACDDFEIAFSNKFDMNPTNLRKIELWELDLTECEDETDPSCWAPNRIIAGGNSCVESKDDLGDDAPPCLLVDVSDQWLGTVRVRIDRVEFGKMLFEAGDFDSFNVETTGRYRMVVPGLGSFESLQDAADNASNLKEVYQAAFHDACGMPLITAGYESDTPDFHYNFSIDSPKCKEDTDGDGVQLSCDNAGKNFNPEQADADRDSFGDVVDLCVVTPSQTNSGDSDKDGIGNDCDNCRQQAENYNEFAMDAGVQAYLWVRNNPFQTDFDQDGIGDACDNCPAVANCQGYGPSADGLDPWEVNDPVDDENTNVCQTDDDADMIGDVCEEDGGMGIQLPGAAGPVGFAEDDDFDQDGLTNMEDVCPRQPAEGAACSSDDECPAETACGDSGVCNHRDTDGDGVGNICDTCPFNANFDQITDGGMQEDDEDQDFVGSVCESYSACYIRKDPRPYGFFDVASDGLCCTTVYPGDGAYVEDDDGNLVTDEEGNVLCEGLCDPDGLPIKLDCQNEPEKAEDRIPDGVKCRQLPNAVLETPGIVDLPPGCVDALADAGISAEDNVRLDINDYNGSFVEMWADMCFLPQWDQDFDGIGDACELKPPCCAFSFDPNNEPYVDGNGKVWKDNCKYCSGEYDIEERCKDIGGDGGDETGTGTDTGDTGESGTGTSG